VPLGKIVVHAKLCADVPVHFRVVRHTSARVELTEPIHCFVLALEDHAGAPVEEIMLIVHLDRVPELRLGLVSVVLLVDGVLADPACVFRLVDEDRSTDFYSICFSCPAKVNRVFVGIVYAPQTFCQLLDANPNP